ncbi:MAG: LptE family protein [Bacteroidetes bacterium]|nr:LptE family protein [Bacteroidota bacterium]
MNKIIILLTSYFLLLTSAGCKMGYSLNGASIPPEAKTVSVLYFTNNTALAPPTLSQQFTEAMKDICATQTKLGLVNKGGDLSFEGYVSDYRVSPLAIQTNDQAALSRLTVSVQVKYINKFDEKKNFETTFTRFADFNSTLSLASQEPTLIPLINKQLTEDIFNKAFNNW